MKYFQKLIISFFILSSLISLASAGSKEGFTTSDMASLVGLDLAKIEGAIQGEISKEEHCSLDNNSLTGLWRFVPRMQEERYKDTNSANLRFEEPQEKKSLLLNPKLINKGNWSFFLDHKEEGWIEAYTVFVGECDGKKGEFQMLVTIDLSDGTKIKEVEVKAAPVY